MKTPVEGKILGKQINYPEKYTPEILVAVPRALNRELYHLTGNNIPFCGVDVWHAYELGFLTKTGMPVTGVLKMVYPANSQFLVESKSMKLYLNSFNMERYGSSTSNAIETVKAIIEHDLSVLLKAEMKVRIFSLNPSQLPFDFSEFEILEDLEEMGTVVFDTFKETPSFLEPDNVQSSKLRLGTHLLRSNCKITHQPDWGSTYIYIKGHKLPTLNGLLKYIVSIRNENHFHEEICEMIYKRLWDIFSPEELMVTCIYTRRGGIDICPVRASHPSLFPINLANPEVLSAKLLRQ